MCWTTRNSWNPWGMLQNFTVGFGGVIVSSLHIGGVEQAHAVYGRRFRIIHYDDMR